VIYRRPFTIEVGRGSGICVTRRQMPLVRAYAMVRALGSECVVCVARSCARSLRAGQTINKSQGQTLDRVLYDARRLPHQHGHAYVLFSRVRSRHDLAAVVDDGTCEGRARGRRTLVTANLLYDELLHGKWRATAGCAAASAGDGARHECARCVEFIARPRPGTMLCEGCEEEVDGGDSDGGERDDESADEGRTSASESADEFGN
jgi:hypothetical protein